MTKFKPTLNCTIQCTKVGVRGEQTSPARQLKKMLPQKEKERVIQDGETKRKTGPDKK